MTNLEDLRKALRGAYELERELGRGGMATVYLAHDLRHDRPVALKVLHSELAQTLGPERFLREIKFAARLQHPHICSVYDSGEVEGSPEGTSAAAGRQLWFTMPYVEGESLRDRLRREHRLCVADTLRIVSEACRGLEYAHQHGVVHRDVKPENILLATDGSTLVADFGIARAFEEPQDQHLTETGLAIGTPAYMAPEQAMGERTVDARADQYSLAAVCYEMLAGVPPFEGASAAALIARRFTGPAPNVRAGCPEAPEAVAHALDRALALRPADRFGSMAEFERELLATPSGAFATVPTARSTGHPRRDRRRFTAALVLLGLAGAGGLGWSLVRARQGAATTLAGVAVLPFRVTGTGQDLALYREGLVDLLSIDLEGAPGVRVLPPGTVLSRWHQDVGRDQDAVDLSVALDVARSVGARYAVLGSLVGAGSSVRVSAAIHELPGGQERGRLQVEGPSDSILRLVDRLTLQVLGTQLLQEGANDVRPDLEGLTTSSLPALKAYLAGEQQLRRAQPRAALEAFQRATTADSGFARGFYRLAISKAYVHSPHIPHMSDEGYELRALALSRHLPAREASLVRALVLTNYGDPRAIDTLRALTRARPNDAEAWFFLGDAAFHLGGVAFAPREEFRQAMQKGLELDPTFALGYVHLTEDAFDRLDSAEARRLTAQIHAIDSTSAKAVGFRLAWDLSWGDPAQKVRARTGMDSLGVDALLTAKHAVDVTPDLWEIGVAAARVVVRNLGFPEQQRAQALDGLRIIYLSRGKVHESVAAFDRLKEVYPGPGLRYAAMNRVFMVALGYADTSQLKGETQFLDTMPREKAQFAIGAAAVRRGDWKEAERRARQLEVDAKAAEAAPDSLHRAFDPPRLRATAQVVRNLAAAARGERPAAIRGLTEASALLGQDPYGEFSAGTLARVRLAELLIDAGNAGEAIRYLQGFDISNSADVVAPVEFLLGRAREQLGDTVQAVQHYQKFARWWADADQELRPRVDEARTAIARLTGEPAQIPGTP